MSIDGAFDVGDRGGIWASWTGFQARIPLKEDVETKALGLAVAECSAFTDIILSIFEVLVGQVSSLLGRCSKISGLLLVPSWSTSSPSPSPKDVVRI